MTKQLLNDNQFLIFAALTQHFVAYECGKDIIILLY